MKQLKCMFLWIVCWAISASIAQGQSPDSTVVHGLRELGSRSMTTGVQSTNHSGIPVSNVAELNTAADDLKAVITAAGVTDFKVYDYASYPFLTFLGKEADGDAMIKAMEEKIAAITPAVPYYLLIGKIIDEQGKVVFKVKLKLPVVASKGNGTGNRSAGLFTAETLKELEGDPEKIMNQNAIDQPGLKYYESHEINGILRITLKIKAQLIFSDSKYYYQPDGYPFCIADISPNNKAIVLDFPPIGMPNGPVYGFLYDYMVKDAMGNDVIKSNYYKAVFETKPDGTYFKGYYLDGNGNNPSVKFANTCMASTNKDEEIIVKTVVYTKHNCNSFSIQGTKYKFNAVPTTGFKIVTSIEVNAKLPNGYGYLSTEPDIQIVSNGCNSVEEDKMKFYFKQFPKKMTSELEKAIDDFCAKLSTELSTKLSSEKEKCREFFKSNSAGFEGTDSKRGKYPYSNSLTETYYDYHINKENESDFIQFVSFIQEVFLPTDFTKWDVDHFKKAGELIDGYYAKNISVKLGKETVNASNIADYTAIIVPEVNGASSKCNYLFKVFENITPQNRVQLINAILSVPKLVEETVFANDQAFTNYVKNKIGKWNALAPIIMNTPKKDMKGLLTLFNSESVVNLFFEKVDPTTALQIAHYITLYQIKNAEKDTDPNKDTKLVQIPFDITGFFDKLSVVSSRSAGKYNLQFYELNYAEVDGFSNGLPPQWQRNGGKWPGFSLTPPDFKAFDLILVRASREKDYISIYSSLQVNGSDYYIVSPFLLEAEKNLITAISKEKAAKTTLDIAVKSGIVVLAAITFNYELAALTTATDVGIVVGVAAMTLEGWTLYVNLSEDVDHETVFWSNAGYFLFTAIRLGGPALIRKIAGTTAGKNLIDKYLEDCVKIANSTKPGISNYLKKLAAKGLKELGVIVCFTAGTPIAAEHGQVPIEKIKAKDKVWSWSFEKNAVVLQEVVQTFKKTTDKLIHLFVGKEIIHTTPEHPFFVPQTEQLYASANNNIINNGEKGAWIAAKNLKQGTKIFLLSTLLATIDSTYAQDTVCTVYNFEVANTHNYFVGKEGVLVHNLCWADFVKTIGLDNTAAIQCLWGSKPMYERLMATGTQTAKAASNFKNLVGKEKDIVFGLFSKNLQDLKEFAKSIAPGSSTWHQFAERGFCNTINESHIIPYSAPGYTLSRDVAAHEVTQAMVRCREIDGTIHFRLDGLSRNEWITGLNRNPRYITNAEDFTCFELRNIIRNEDWINNTIFYVNGTPYTLAKNVTFLEKYGIKLILK